MKTETENEYSAHILKQDRTIQALTTENEKLKADLHETTIECQKHIDAVEDQNDDLEKEIEKLKTKFDVSASPTATENGEKKKTEPKKERTLMDVIYGR